MQRTQSRRKEPQRKTEQLCGPLRKSQRTLRLIKEKRVGRKGDSDVQNGTKSRHIDTNLEKLYRANTKANSI